ncbi:HDOD domain-containing protein [Chitinimonas sp.]|uniref:HDOD domain-containing protein n=1 Tax=Chitinimonas sp. TaxID=1934313 RepID=UPI0035AF0E75
MSAAVDRMPVFPKSVQRILELTRDINCLPRDIVAVIEKDPIITIKLLKLINSAYYSLPNKITSIKQSVVHLGINTVKNLALSFSAIGMLPSQNGAGFDMQGYLMHSLVSANIARRIGEVCAAGEVDPTDCYIAGLLHDFGKVVFAQFMAEEFGRALAYSRDANLPLHKAEVATMGVDHTLVGAMLARRWQFPAELVDCIDGHHGPVFATPLAQCLYAADCLSEQLGYGAADNLGAEHDKPQWPERFGADVDALVSRLGSFDDIISEAEQYAKMGRE